MYTFVTGNDSVTFYELNSIYGHDTFLLDLNGVGAGVKVSSMKFMYEFKIVGNLGAPLCHLLSFELN